MITWICNHDGCTREVSGLFGMPQGRAEWCIHHQQEAIEREHRERERESALKQKSAASEGKE